MDYYDKKKALLREVKAFVNDPANSNKAHYIPWLELKFAEKFGFGRKIILKAFEYYVYLGKVEITEDFIIIRGKKVIEKKPVESNNNPKSLDTNTEQTKENTEQTKE